MRVVFTAFVLFFTALVLNAQWSDEPADNLRLGTQSDSATSSLITFDKLGNYYVMYFTQQPEPVNYELYLQKYDKSGNELWEKNGIKIKGTEFDSWISFSSIKCDNENNVLIAIDDKRYEDIERTITLYKISPDGAYLWGENGITLPPEQGFLYLSPQIHLLKDYYLISCDKAPTDDDIAGFPIYKIDKSGNIIKSIEVKRTYEDPLIESSFPEIYPADDENIYFTWSILRKKEDDDSTYGGWGQRTQLLQKFDKELTQIWAEDLKIINPNFDDRFRIDHSVSFATDNDGGLYWAWFANVEFNANVFVNHIDKSNNLMLNTDGKEVQTLPDDCSNLEPKVVVNLTDNSFYVFWIQEKVKQNYRGTYYCEYGVWGNKLNSDKTWEWSDNGSEIMRTECYFEPYIIKAANAVNGRIVLFYTDGSLTLEAGLVDDNEGKLLNFAGMSYDVNSRQLFSPTKLMQKSYFEITDLANDQWVATWTDILAVKDQFGIIPNSGVYVQNLNTDGSIGPNPSGIINKNDDKSEAILLFPNPANSELTISFDLNIEMIPLVQIFDVSGKIVKSSVNVKVVDNKIVINSSDLKSGTYFIKFKIYDYDYSTKFVK